MASPYHPETAAVPAPGLPTLHQFFAPGGLLSQAHPNYEFRRGQLQMAEAVERALAEKRHLIVEVQRRPVQSAVRRAEQIALVVEEVRIRLRRGKVSVKPPRRRRPAEGRVVVKWGSTAHAGHQNLRYCIRRWSSGSAASAEPMRLE